MRIALVTTDNRECFKRYSNPEPEFGAAPEALLQGFAALPDVEVHVVCCTRKPLQAPEKLAPNIYYHSLLVPKRGWMTTGYLGCIRAVRRLLSTIRPDLVHGQGTERECAMAAAFSGYPNLVTIHGHMRHIARITGAKPFSFGWLAARLESVAVRRTNGLLCLSSFSRNVFASHARRAWIVVNAAREPFFQVPRNPVRPPEIICIAHVHPWKNQNFLLQSLAGLDQELDFRLVFYGEANPNADYGRQFLALMGSQKRCEFRGGANLAGVKAALSRAHALILPSTEDNCPVAVLEAMAAGVPVAAATIGGVPDLLTHQKTGLLFNPHSMFEVRDVIRALVRDDSLAVRIGAAGRAHAQAHFNPVVVATKHLEIYSQITPRGAVAWSKG